MDVFESGIFYGEKLHPSKTNMGDDDFANFGNPEKRAARKQAKAEKKLEKAKTANPRRAARLTKAATRKLAKVDKIVNKFGLTQTSIVDVGTQDESDDVLASADKGTIGTQPATTTTQQPVCNGGGYEGDMMPVPKMDTTKMLLYGGIGLATIFAVGMLLSRKGEMKMATH
jgi:hypothetical protein